MVDSTQQFVRNPAKAIVSMPLDRRMKSRLVDANASRPRLPSMTMSPSAGLTSSTNAAPQLSLTNELDSTTPARMPYGVDEISAYPAAKLIGEWITVAPAVRAASTTSAVFFIIPVDSMTSLTAPCSVPPSVATPFWYSMRTTAARFGSIAGVSDIVVSVSSARASARAGRSWRGGEFDGSPAAEPRPAAEPGLTFCEQSTAPGDPVGHPTVDQRADEVVDNRLTGHKRGEFIRAGVV